MEVCAVYLNNDKAPVSGCALYVVIEQRERQVTLLHPITLDKFDVPATEYASGHAGQYWPNNTTKSRFDPLRLADLMVAKMQDFSNRRRAYPQQVVRRAVAVLRSVPVDKVPAFREAEVAPRGFAVPSEKRPGVVNAIADLLHKGVTIDEAVAELRKLFPDRKADGMRTTVRCQINRLPAKLNVKLVTIDDKKRGKVFKFAQ